jgi:replicative DNA helicase
MKEVRAINERDTLAPASIEAEQQILGAILTDSALLDRASDLVDKSTFFDPVHAEIYEVCVNLIESGSPATPITVQPAFEHNEQLKALGGVPYLAKLVVHAVMPDQIRDYAQLIADLKSKRDLLVAMRQSYADLKEGKKPSYTVASYLEDAAGKVNQATTTKPLVRSHLSTLISAMDQIEKARQGLSDRCVPTGLKNLDSQLAGGFRGGQLIVLGARPAMGKTTLAQSIAYTMARNGTGVFYGSLEMSGPENAMRLLSRGLKETGHSLPYKALVEGRISDDQMRVLVDEAKVQQSLPIFVSERHVRALSRFRAAIKRVHQQLADTPTPLGCVFVDYLQLLQGDDRSSAYERVSAASDMLKSVALELDIPVVALAQLNRSVENREPPVPGLADLRESGKLEEDADVVMFCYRQAYYIKKALELAKRGGSMDKLADTQADYDACKDLLTIIIDKQRSGPTGNVDLYCDLPTSHVFNDRSEREDYLI